MLILELESDKKTPYVKLTNESLQIKGRSYPENSIKFYKPLMNYLNDSDDFKTFFIELDVEYINTSSSKLILYIIRKICEKTTGKVLINWYIDEDDDSMDETCDMFKYILKDNVEINKLYKL